ncbi:hypothetical protein C0J52_24729 [Blattella germanica]|nr:hypothetical protein C0J52_24729 [Blattella germanica]
MDLAIAGFECTGIYPFNKDIFGEVDFLPATNTRTMLENDPRVDNAPKDQLPPTNTSLPVSITPVKESLPVNVVASTSSSQTFQRAIQQISPVADDLQRKIVMRKAKRQKTQKTTNQRNCPDQKEVQAKPLSKRKLQFRKDEPSVKNGSKETKCLICNETFEEDWVQCCTCGGWAHVGCADSDNIMYFVCV